MKTKYDLAIWHSLGDGETYAFPLGATDVWGDAIYPALNDQTWSYKGTMPKGCPVADLKVVTGNRVRCKLNGASVNTANWAIES